MKILYHGSASEIKNLEYGIGNPKNDYGLGFYCIENIELAKLAKETGVSLRSIQMYEQRKKDVNKANAISLFRISRVLGCEMEDLLE